MILIQTLVPICICVILPISIVLILSLTTMSNNRNRTKVLIKAIESGNDIDTNRLAEAMQRPTKTDGQIRTLRLLRGCIFSLVGIVVMLSTLWDIFDYEMLLIGGIFLAIGVSYLIVFIVTRRQPDNED